MKLLIKWYQKLISTCFFPPIISVCRKSKKIWYGITGIPSQETETNKGKIDSVALSGIRNVAKQSPSTPFQKSGPYTGFCKHKMKW